MRFRPQAREPEKLFATASDSLDRIRSDHGGTIAKAALVAGGVAALTAGSAAISSLRRRLEGSP